MENRNMTTNKDKSQAAATPAVIEGNTLGLKGFNGSAIVKAVSAAFTSANEAKTHAEAKAEAAFTVCVEAQRVRAENKLLDREAWSNSWRSSVRGILPQLHAAGIDWVEQTATTLNDGSERIGYKLSGYGQNISSDANQTGQYDIDAVKAESLQGVRKAIKACKAAEELADMSPEQLECAELAGLLDDGFKVLKQLLAEAESAEAYQVALESMAEMIELNTPIVVPTAVEEPAADSDVEPLSEDAALELAELITATA
jgi:hypothetical protein